MNNITNVMQMSRKKIKKNPFASSCDWLVGHYSFNLSLALKSIAPIPNAHAIKVANTLLLCKA